MKMGMARRGSAGGQRLPLVLRFQLSAFQRLSFVFSAPRLGPTGKSERAHLGEQQPAET